MFQSKPESITVLAFTKRFLLYVTVCSIGIFMSFYPTILSRFQAMQTDVGDTRLNHYFLEHSFQLISNDNYIGELWSPRFFYPYDEILTFSDNLFGSAPIYWFFRSLFDADLSYQLWMIAVLTICFFSFLFLMTNLKVSPGISAAGAFLFSFSMPRILQLGHQQLLPQFFTPLAFLSGWHFFQRPNRKDFLLFLIFIYLQVLAGIYLGWFLLFSLPIFFGIACIIEPEGISRLLTYWKTTWKLIIFSLLSWSTIMFLTLLPYLKSGKVLGNRSYSEVDSMLPRVISWFSVPLGSPWSFLLSWTSKHLPMAHEHYLFPGFVVVILAFITIWDIFRLEETLPKERRSLVKICIFTFIVIFCLCIRLPFGFSAWRLVYELVPGASVIRAVTRIWTIAYFYLFLGIFLFLDSLFKSYLVNKSKYYLVVLLTGLTIALAISEQIVFSLPSFEKVVIRKDVSEMSQLMSQGCEVSYFYFDNVNHPFFAEQLSAMWAGIEANTPVVNGYSGNEPPNYGRSISEPKKPSEVFVWLNSFDKTRSSEACIIAREDLEQKGLLSDLSIMSKNTSPSGNFYLYRLANIP